MSTDKEIVNLNITCINDIVFILQAIIIAARRLKLSMFIELMPDTRMLSRIIFALHNKNIASLNQVGQTTRSFLGKRKNILACWCRNDEFSDAGSNEFVPQDLDIGKFNLLAMGWVAQSWVPTNTVARNEMLTRPFVE